jgi:glutamate synthase domain-containing protein 2
MFALGCIQALKCHKNTCPTGITTHDPRFQAGLVVEDKDKRVANYVKAIVKDVETIAHSVGVSEPRKLTRRHVRIVQDDGRSIPMDRQKPTPTTSPPAEQV